MNPAWSVLFYLAIGSAAWWWLTRKPRSKRDGTRYLHAVERRAMGRDRLDTHEGLCSEEHERECARSMPHFYAFQQIAKRPNMTLADLRERAAGKPTKTNVSTIRRVSRRK